MKSFVLCPTEIDHEDLTTGRELHKAYEWPLIPRTDDYIGVGGNQYEVFEVIHNLDRDPPTIHVIVRVSKPEFEALSEDTSWERVFWDI